MKKISKLFAGICIVMCIAFYAFNVCASDGDVEIKFAVGDSTLSINGEDVTVTTPYVVEGTTLVPVRVITEAFGAEVLWNDAEQSVTINYRDVEIKLAIGNKTAYINGNPIELLAAPELTNSTTMLPLRFITESFGADVTYDEKTEAITVLKQMTISNSIRDYSLVLKRSNKELVGDSYLGWSMARSPDMKLTYRSFDGMESTFENEDETGYIDIVVSKLDDETIDDIYDFYRQESKKYSVNKFEKIKSPSGVDYVVIRYSTANYYFEDRAYVKGDVQLLVTTALKESEGREKFNELIAITDTFDMNYDSAKTEDLSDVDKNTGNHTYTSDYFGLEMDIPGYLYLIENEAKKNSIEFFDYDDENIVSLIGVNLYSSYEGHDAKKWAEFDHKNNKELYDKSYATFTDVEEKEIAGHKAYVYELIEKKGDNPQTMYDMFIEAGDYFYNIAIQGKNGKIENIKDSIIKSIMLKKIDAKEVGQLIRTDDEGPFTYKDYEMKSARIYFKAPSNWVKVAEDKTGMVLADTETSRSMAIVAINPESTGRTAVAGFVQSMYTESSSNFLYTMLDLSPRKIQVGKKNAHLYRYAEKMDDGDRVITYVYIFDSEKYYIVVQFSVNEYANGDKTREIFDRIVSSLSYT